jgi:hypothetical protein
MFGANSDKQDNRLPILHNRTTTYQVCCVAQGLNRTKQWFAN